MNYHEIELEISEYNKETKEWESKGKQEVRFRLTSGYCIEIENKSNKKIQEYIQEESITTCVTLLRHMRRFEMPNFSMDDAQKLFDQLVDNGWIIKTIIQDIIYETLVVSGFLSKEEWEKIKTENEQLEKKIEKKKDTLLENI